ncbi:MAG: formate dehydrogenase accessory sulfurtransferase FdhD [Archaeoglobaceae archaeon]
MNPNFLDKKILKDLKIIGDPLEIAVEKEIALIINGKPHYLMCTPSMLKELAVGFLISEGIVKQLEDIKVELHDDLVLLEIPGSSFATKIHSSGCIGVKINEFKKRVEPKKKFSISTLKEYLSLLEVEEYKKTRGYHIAVVVENERFFRAYDVGRHNAVDKAIGFAALQKANFDESFLLLSGRISRGIAMKCANTGIPLIVSKAAIFDSAIEFCIQTGLSAVSFATNIAIGKAVE